MFFIDVFCPLRDLEVMDGVLAGSIFFSIGLVADWTMGVAAWG